MSETVTNEVRADAWDEGERAATETWTRLIGWATGPNPTRETAPRKPTNPYRTREDG